MPLLTLKQYSLHYGEQVIFQDMALQLDAGVKLCLVGRNGVGKSTLLACMMGEREPDSGERWLESGVKVACLSQELPPQGDESVFDFVAQGLEQIGLHLARYYTVSHSPEPDLQEMENLQQKIESADGWRIQNRVEQIITRLDLDAQAPMKSLSGGWRRRAALAQALVSEPQILLLDEPTNHLDVAAIKWLEEFLQSFEGALVFITHDRAFLRKVANAVGELDRGQLTVLHGSYDSFLKLREEQLAAEEKHRELFDKKLAQEETWIRQGIKARRTRNEGRVRALKAMREEHSQRLQQLGKVRMEVSGDVSSGKLVSELNDVSFARGNNRIIENFSCIVQRGDKIGLIGPNGIGKTTLLKIMLGELQADSGTVNLGSKLSVAYFDQLRAQLDLEKDARENIAGGQDFVEINGARRHVMSYLQDFMFSGERTRTPIKTLSGGERNRILLAQLFCKPANLLVLDEPTNDLDMETLELLEDLLLKFEGTLLLVSHDREFMDNVVTSTIAFEGRGSIKQYVGGYSDWQRQGGTWPELSDNIVDEKAEDVNKPQAETQSLGKQVKVVRKKLSYKLQRELEKLPEDIEKLENQIEALEKEISSPTFYQLSVDETQPKIDQFSELQANLEQLYQRWEELDASTQAE